VVVALEAEQRAARLALAPPSRPITRRILSSDVPIDAFDPADRGSEKRIF
jgi:hypothetical protein